MSDVDCYCASTYSIIYKYDTAVNRRPRIGGPPPGPKFPYLYFNMACTHYGEQRSRSAGIRKQASAANRLKLIKRWAFFIHRRGKRTYFHLV